MRSWILRWPLSPLELGGTGIYRDAPGDEFKLVYWGLALPADIGFDSKRSIVLVPVMTENTLHGDALQ